MVLVSWNGSSRQLPFHVIDGDGPSLLGRDWLSALNNRVTGLQPPTNVHAFRTEVPFDHVDIPLAAPQPPPPAAGDVRTPPPEAAGDAHPPTVKQLACEFECFREGLGCSTGPPISILPDPAVKPIHLKARPVPFALEAEVGAELDRIVANGILEPKNELAWATPIVVVKKAGGGIRICGDHKSTVNKAVLPETYHMPTIDEAFAKLAPAHTLSKIDLVKRLIIRSQSAT